MIPWDWIVDEIRDREIISSWSDPAAFQLADLQRLRFAAVCEVPTPWMCLQHDLRERGIDPDQVRRIADRPMAGNLADFLRARPDNSANVILGSYSIHHFATEAKIDIINDCHRVLTPAGTLLWIDAVRHDGETHDDYITRLTGVMAHEWTALTADQRAKAVRDLLGAHGVSLTRLLTIAATAKVFGVGSRPGEADPADRRVGFSVLLETTAQP